MTKSEVTKAMIKFAITGEVRGFGMEWEVEVPSSEMMDKFHSKIGYAAGMPTESGSWILRPGYMWEKYWENPPLG